MTSRRSDVAVIEWTTSLVIQNGAFTQNAFLALWLLAFAESSFFPIPPDFIFIPMGAIQPDKAFLMAFLLTTASVLGGALGYSIGLFGGRPIVTWLVNTRFVGKIFNQEKFDMVEDYYKRYDFWAVLIAAFTPIPFKVFTIGGGLCRINFWKFMIVATLGRAGRFFLVASLLYFFQEQAGILVKNFDKFLIVMTLLLIAGFFVMKYIKPGKKTD
jgi:membrane protein YqaA with SNARE-associated domain